MKRTIPIIPIIILLIVGLLFAGFLWWMRGSKTQQPDSKPANEYSEDTRVAFVENTYQLIKDNYWQAISDEELSTLYFQALSKNYGPQPELKEKNRQAIADLVEKLLNDLPETDHNKNLAQTVDIVLQNLQPLGRSRLYQQQDEQALQNLVTNVDPDTDLFSILDVDQTASDSAIEQAYERKVADIKQTVADKDQQAEQLAQAERAKQALASEQNRVRYQQTKVEPTVSNQLLDGNILYLDWSKFSPTTIEDFQQSLQELNRDNQISAMILDLRGNVGGAIDALPYLLGPFLGNNQYAYQFFSHGQTLDFKTKVAKLPELAPIKRIVILIDGQTQSSAEVMAASLKKYHIGVVVGEKTKGWGTVERVFPLEHQLDDQQKLSLFLVHSLTLDESGQPIEGQGVSPDVSIADSNWQAQLREYFADEKLINAVEKLVE